MQTNPAVEQNAKYLNLVRLEVCTVVICGDVDYCQNLLEKPTEREYYTDNAVAMVQCKVLKQLQLLEGRKIDDQDIVDDVNFLNETLQASVQDLRFVAV